MAKGGKQPGNEKFWKRVGSNSESKIFFQRAIEAMGVPKNSFKLIEGGVTSTYEEALAVEQFLKKVTINQSFLLFPNGILKQLI